MAIVAAVTAGCLSSAQLRNLTGRRVHVETCDGTVEGEVISCTTRSLWLVDRDDDHVVPLDEITTVRVS